MVGEGLPVEHKMGGEEHEEAPLIPLAGVAMACDFPS